MELYFIRGKAVAPDLPSCSLGKSVALLAQCFRIEST